jgi:hypothetical protein
MVDLTHMYRSEHLLIVSPHKLHFKNKHSRQFLEIITNYLPYPIEYTNELLRLLIIYGPHKKPIYIFQCLIPNLEEHKHTNHQKQYVISLIFNDPMYDQDEVICKYYINQILKWIQILIYSHSNQYDLKLIHFKYSIMLHINKIIKDLPTTKKISEDLHDKILMFEPEIIGYNHYIYTYLFKHDEQDRIIEFDRSFKSYYRPRI